MVPRPPPQPLDEHHEPLSDLVSFLDVAGRDQPAFVGASVSAAQGTPRTFPESALRGKLVVTLPPEVSLNGKPDRLSPGARIHDTSNLLVMSGGLINRELVVNYVRDGHGLIHEVWILTPQEAAMKRPARPA
jgi:hypothetical protein